MWGYLEEEKFIGDMGGETGRGDTLGEDDEDPEEPGDGDRKQSSLRLVCVARISLSL